MSNLRSVRHLGFDRKWFWPLLSLKRHIMH